MLSCLPVDPCLLNRTCDQEMDTILLLLFKVIVLVFLFCLLMLLLSPPPFCLYPRRVHCKGRDRREQHDGMRLCVSPVQPEGDGVSWDNTNIQRPVLCSCSDDSTRQIVLDNQTQYTRNERMSSLIVCIMKE